MKGRPGDERHPARTGPPEIQGVCYIYTVSHAYGFAILRNAELCNEHNEVVRV